MPLPFQPRRCGQPADAGWGPRLLLALVGVVAGAGAALAQGGPPMLTDDPGTPGPGRWEINLAATHEAEGETRRWEAPLVDANLGVGERHQLKAEVPWVILAPEGDSTRSGIGNANLGWKYRIIDREVDGRGFDLSLYPQYEFNLSPHSADRGLGEHEPTLLLPVQIAAPAGPVSLDGEVGVTLRSGDVEGWIYGVVIGGEVAEAVELMAELNGTASRRERASTGVVNAGFRWGAAPNASLIASAGTGLWSTKGDSPRRIGYVGVQLRF